MDNFTLKDNLKFQTYSFPKTMLVYKKEGQIPNPKQDVLLMDGEKVPYEVSKRDGGYNLKIIADLPYLGSHEFCWEKGENNFNNFANDNGIIRVESIKNGLFSVVLKNGKKFTYTIKTDLKIKDEEEQISGGVIECIFTKTLTFENREKYIFTIKLKKDLDYIEIYEEIVGFSQNQAKLQITWDNFNPTNRYTKERDLEKIDDYIDESGKMPFVINPFMPKTSWWDVPFMSFVEKTSGFWSGILLHDLKNFDDKQYAIWGSKNNLAFVLYEDRIEGNIADGKRAFMHVFCQDKHPKAIESFYRRYYSILSLNKIKDYVLEWEDDKNDYPKYFDVKENTKWGGFYGERVGKPTVEDMMNILDRDCTMLTKLEELAPVACRAFRTTWAQTFDLTAKQMTDEQFRRVRAVMALVCYVYSDEDYYPTEKLLAGHPNFLIDVAGVVGVFGALLGKKHPMHKKWLAYYEIVLAKSFKYHVRPDVEEWQAKGGRWTENFGAYMLHMLNVVVFDSNVIYRLNDGEVPFLYPHIKSFVEILVNMQMAEDSNGRRVYGPHGAHSCNGSHGGEFGCGFTLTMIELADMLKNYYPLLSEYILHNYRKDKDFEGVLEANSIYGDSYRPFTTNNHGTTPLVGSEKYTGFGFMLRDHENTSGEMSVFLQQIDEGPNYRWGRAAQGGCGEIFYYANHRKYTDHSPEDVGDENRGDNQSCTNFGVLVGHEYKSVGRNSLTEPLMDFDFVKYARINAGEYSSPYYKNRSVMMVNNRYIAVYDAVADKFQHGKFSWSQSKKGDFPNIKNIKPGVTGFVSGSGVPIDVKGEYKSKFQEYKVMNFVGQGDFFTIVTHLRTTGDEKQLCSINAKEYGAELVFPQTTDKVFFDQSRIIESNKDYSFDGYVGYLTENVNEKKVAIFNGKSIEIKGFGLEIPFDKDVRHGMSGVKQTDKVFGDVQFLSGGLVKIKTPQIKNAKVFIDGKICESNYIDGAYEFYMPQGKHKYFIAQYSNIDKVSIDCVVSGANGFDVKWQGVYGAEKYQIFVSSDYEYTYNKIGEVEHSDGQNVFKCRLDKVGKYYVKVLGVSNKTMGEFSHPYPVYVSKDLPSCPQGLRVEKKDDAFLATWGEVLGCDKYRLYKTSGDKCELVYEGNKRGFVVGDGEYFVTAINNNGESRPSLLRASDDIRANWDNRPDLAFIRDTRSFEHGYSGFDYLHNPKKPTLEYPRKEKD